jgi:hypothetical protein
LSENNAQDGQNDKVLGILLAVMLDPVQERSAKELFVNLRQTSSADNGGPKDQLLNEELDNFLAYPARLVNPEIAPLLLSLLKNQQDNKELCQDTLLRKAVTLLLLKLAQASRKNLVALAKTGILDILLDWLFPSPQAGQEIEGGKGKEQEKDGESEEKDVTLPPAAHPSDLSEDERDILTRLVRTILFYGASTRNIRYIVSRILRQRMNLEEEAKERLNLPLLKLLLDGLRASRWPPFIHFDTSKYPYASLTLPQLANRQFPPFNNNGYSFMGWINIDRFPYSTASSESPIGVNSPQMDILTIQDEKQVCSVRLHIDSATRTLAFQTGQHAPVQCANTFIEEDRWYHVAGVHHRGSRSVPASITVLLDGRKVEDHIPCPWPTSPEKGTTVSASLGLTRASAKAQGFLGRESCDTGIWSLGPTWLLDLEISEEMVFICYTLGPRYTGNFQDRLGQFQTYQSSTMLNLHLENLYGGSKHAGNSPLVHAIRGKASAFIPENRIYFAFNANNALEAGQADTHPLSARKSESIRSDIDAIAASSSGRIIFNAAVIDLDNALKSPDSGIASIEGDVTIGTPHSLDLAFDKVGGSPLACKWVDSAKDSEELEISINVWEEVFRNSWRMSEDVERSQSYEVLSTMWALAHFPLVNRGSS